MTVDRILLALAPDDSSDPAVELVAALSANSAAEVTVLSVDATAQAEVDAGAEPALSGRALLLESAATRIAAAGGRARTAELAAEPSAVADEIVDLAERARAQLIVLGSGGRSPAVARVFGGVARRVASNAPCPVLVVGPRVEPLRPPAHLVLAVTDASAISEEIDLAAALAVALEAKITILHVVGPVEEAIEDLDEIPESLPWERTAERLVARLGEAGVAADSVTVPNRRGLAAEIAGAADSIGSNLVFVGSEGAGSPEAWLPGASIDEVFETNEQPAEIAPSKPRRHRFG